jgi:hypothetical protein
MVQKSCDVCQYLASPTTSANQRHRIQANANANANARKLLRSHQRVRISYVCFSNQNVTSTESGMKEERKPKV